MSATATTHQDPVDTLSAANADAVPPSDLAPALASRRPEDFEVPTGREEQWRFTPMDRLLGLAGDAGFDAIAQIDVGAPDGVSTALLDDAAQQALPDAWTPTDRVSARALAAAPSATLVDIPADAEVDAPVHIVVTAPEGASASHLIVRAGERARATVVLEHRGPGAHAGVVEAAVGTGGRLTLISVQDAAATAVHLGHQHLQVGRDAQVLGINVTLGGDVVRLTTGVQYAGPGGDAELCGVYFADAGQHQEHRLFVDHDAPHCRSRVTYKGALQGDGAHTVWVGDVLIRASALGTDTYELNRNLVLSEGARADSVPNLEIETGRIEGAGHASATGRFDDEQLFYLQSRGIPEALARRLVVVGFFAEVLERIGVPAVTERLLARVEEELGYTHEADDALAAPDLAVADA